MPPTILSWTTQLLGTEVSSIPSEFRECSADNCPSLAWYELRFIVAKMFLHFDVTLCDDSRDWMKQKAYSLWDMGPLNCTLKRRQ